MDLDRNKLRRFSSFCCCFCCWAEETEALRLTGSSLANVPSKETEATVRDGAGDNG